MSSYGPVRSIVRAVRVLTVLNGFGESSLSEIARRAEIAKATTLRIPETLATEGLVERCSGTGKYRVGNGVQRLSTGYVATNVIDAAVQRIETMTRTLQWPGTVALAEGSCMRLHFGTQRNNPLTL